jgi:hypothetical protein
VRLPSRTIKVWDPVFPGSQLATKHRLARAPFAPGIPRASPTPTPADAPLADPMDVDPDPTLVPDDNTKSADVDPTDEIGPMFGPYGDDDSGAGLYASDEDRYPG